VGTAQQAIASSVAPVLFLIGCGCVRRVVGVVALWSFQGFANSALASFRGLWVTNSGDVVAVMWMGVHWERVKCWRRQEEWVKTDHDVQRGDAPCVSPTSWVPPSVPTSHILPPSMIELTRIPLLSAEGRGPGSQSHERRCSLKQDCSSTKCG